MDNFISDDKHIYSSYPVIKTLSLEEIFLSIMYSFTERRLESEEIYAPMIWYQLGDGQMHCCELSGPAENCKRQTAILIDIAKNLNCIRMGFNVVAKLLIREVGTKGVPTPQDFADHAEPNNHVVLIAFSAKGRTSVIYKIEEKNGKRCFGQKIETTCGQDTDGIIAMLENVFIPDNLKN